MRRTTMSEQSTAGLDPATATRAAVGEEHERLTAIRERNDDYYLSENDVIAHLAARDDVPYLLARLGATENERDAYGDTLAKIAESGAADPPTWNLSAAVVAKMVLDQRGYLPFGRFEAMKAQRDAALAAPPDPAHDDDPPAVCTCDTTYEPGIPHRPWCGQEPDDEDLTAEGDTGGT